MSGQSHKSPVRSSAGTALMYVTTQDMGSEHHQKGHKKERGIASQTLLQGAFWPVTKTAALPQARATGWKPHSLLQ
jgi:hypothetical protein